MDWHRTYTGDPGYTSIIGPAADGLRFISFGMLRLAPQDTFTGDTGQSELGLVVLSGACRLMAGEKVFPQVGRREHFFAAKPAAVYLPPRTAYEVQGVTQVEVAVGSVPADSDGEATYVDPATVVTKVFGEGPAERTVHFVIHDAVPAARLIVGETTHVSGGWSGYPPHKHDRDNLPLESANEEVYLVKVEPSQGFGFLRIYDREQLDETYCVGNNHVVAIPRGYHPMVGAPGYRVGFVWFMAGEKRPWVPQVDPDHTWVA